MSLEEVAERACHKVFMEIENFIRLIVGNQQGVLDQPLRPRQNYYLNIVILFNDTK